MSRNYAKHWLYPLMLCISGASFAGEIFKVNCPATLQVEQRVVGEHPAWESTAENLEQFGYMLKYVGIYYGHPKDRASSIPDSSYSERLQRSTWRLLGNSAQKEYWVACFYHNTLQMLVRRLPQHLKSCEESSITDTRGATLKVNAMVCR